MELLLGPGLLFMNAVLGGLLVALLCSLLGVYVVLRRLVLLGVALPQASAAGIAAAFWLTGHAHQASHGDHTIALLGSVGATFGALALMVIAQRWSQTPAEWKVGALFAVTSAATVLFVAIDPIGDLEMTNLLRGELLSLGDTDLAILVFASAGVVLLFFAFRREILLASFDAEFARTIGREPDGADVLLFALLGLSIALGVMDAGPLVVFGFLVLPALAALGVAPSLGAALAISASIGVLASVSGFALAYRLDLPTGPTSVALAAGFWLVVSGVARFARRMRGKQSGNSSISTLLLMLLLLAPGLAGTSGCSSASGGRRETALPRGSLPDLSARGPVVVARFRNETGQPLPVASGNPLSETKRAIGALKDSAWTVTDSLQQRAVSELARRGIAVRSFEEDRALLPDIAPAKASAVMQVARAAQIESPVLTGTLRRFTVTNTGLLLVRLELTLLHPASGEILWSGEVRRPIAVRSALTMQELLLDAGPPIFAEAFESD